MRILLTFIQDNRLRLVDWFNQFDKDHSGGISREEFKTGLKETGLVMTQVYYSKYICYFLQIFLLLLLLSLMSWMLLFLLSLSIQRQLDRLMDFIDINDDGEIEFR